MRAQDKSVPTGPASSGAGAVAAPNRLVLVDVTATDAQGHPITLLTEEDFQVVEKVGWATQVPEKIEEFRVANTTQLQNKQETRQSLRAPFQVQGDLAANESAAPLTILLLDNLRICLPRP